MVTTVRGPGFSVNFPDGTDRETIDRVMREAYAKQHGTQPSPLTSSSAQSSSTASRPGTTRLDIGGRIVEIGDNFLSMTREQQQQTVDEIERALFAEAPPTSPGGSPKLVPVDYDPFATASDAKGDRRTQTNLLGESYQQAIQPPPPDESFGRNFRLGVQNVGSFAADIAGAPVDTATAVINGLSGAANLAGRGAEITTGVNVPDIPRIVNPVAGSDDIKDTFSKMFERLGIGTIDESEMTPRQRRQYNIQEFAGQALGGGAGLIKSATLKSTPVIEKGASSLAQYIAKAIPDYITNPYKQAPGRMLASDVAGGAGAGAALEAADDYLPESVAEHPLTRLLAVLLGGAAGSSALNVATNAPSATLRSITDRQPAAPEFQASDAILPVSKRSVNQAVNYVHENATNPKSALAQLMESLNFFNEAGGAVPTTALMTDDAGLQLLDRGLRDKHPKPFVERDSQVRGSAYNDVENLRPDEGNPYKPRQLSEEEIASRTNAADAGVRAADDRLGAAQKEDLALGSVYEQPPMTREEASAALDKALIQDIGMPMRSKKSDLYRAIDPEGTEMIDTADLVAVAKDLDAYVKTLPSSLRGDMAPEGLINDIKSLEPKIDPETGENVGGPGEVSFQNLSGWRAPLSARENQARKAGQIGIADSTMAVRKQIGAEAEKLAESGSPAGQRAQEANRFYKEDYAPFRTSVVGERMKDIARNPQRDQTPPSETASKLIVKGPGAPEAGANVNAAIARGTPEAQKASHEAITNYFLADLQNVVRGGRVDENKLQRWININKSTLDAYPDFKKEVTDLLQNVRGRGQRNSQLEAEVTAAAANRQATERELNKSAFAMFAGREPDKAVAALFSSDDPTSMVKQFRARFAGDREAEAGLRAAVADHLIEQVKLSGKAGVTGDASPLSLAKLESTFRRNEALLKEVFGSDVQYLNQARRRLEALSRRSNQATPGSATVERTGFQRLADRGMKSVEIVLKLMFGQLEGGGYTRSARLMAERMPDTTAAAKELILRMSFDPELAKHILSATPKSVTTPRWNKRLNRLMGWAEVGRAASEDED